MTEIPELNALPKYLGKTPIYSYSDLSHLFREMITKPKPESNQEDQSGRLFFRFSYPKTDIKVPRR